MPSSPPLGGEHHEDEEDQEDARGDGERPERREERHEGVTGSVGVLDRVRLEGLDLESQLLGHGREARRPRREASPGDVPSSIRDCDDLDLAVAVEQLLRLVERDEHGCVGRAGTIEPDDIPHARAETGGSAGVDDDSISALDAELRAAFELRKTSRAPRSASDSVAAGADDGREPVHPVGVAREEDDARLALALGRRLDGDLLDDRTGDSVDEAGPPRPPRCGNGRLVDPAGAGRRPECTGMSSTAPFGAIVSSVAPSVATAVVRIVWLIVSPVVRAAAMIVVPSISPSTMRALRPRRRPTLRTASLTRMRFGRRGLPVRRAMPSPTRRTTRSVSTGMPKTSFIGYATRTPAVSAKATS